MNLVLSLLGALALTLAIEGLAMLALTRDAKAFRASLLVNLLTNPVMNLLLLLAVRLAGAGVYRPLLLGLEVAVVAGEAALYHKMLGWPAKKALTTSMMLNVLSFLAGLLL